MTNINLIQKLATIRNELNVPKEHSSPDGKYKYRQLDDITKALKPLEKKHNAVTLQDSKPVLIGNYPYIEGTVTFYDLDTGEEIIRHGYARDTIRYNSDYDAAQLTGATTTYAIKRAYEAMFSLSDDNDPDAKSAPMTLDEAKNTPIEYTEEYLEKHQKEVLNGKIENGKVKVGDLEFSRLVRCSQTPYVTEKTKTACIVLLNAINNGEVNGTL